MAVVVVVVVSGRLDPPPGRKSGPADEYVTLTSADCLCHRRMISHMLRTGRSGVHSILVVSS
jgi:hypothetical protein